MKVEGSKPRALSAEAIEKYQAAKTRHSAENGTIRSLIDDYRGPNSLEWSRLAASTKYEWGRALDVIDAKWGTVPIAVFDDIRVKAKIKAWRNSMSETPRKADYHMQVLVALLKWGISEGRVTANCPPSAPMAQI